MNLIGRQNDFNIKKSKNRNSIYTGFPCNKSILKLPYARDCIWKRTLQKEKHSYIYADMYIDICLCVRVFLCNEKISMYVYVRVHLHTLVEEIECDYVIAKGGICILWGTWILTSQVGMYTNARSLAPHYTCFVWERSRNEYRQGIKRRT